MFAQFINFINEELISSFPTNSIPSFFRHVGLI